MAKSEIAVLIFAGGQGRRLGGVEKALIRIAGQTLISRALGPLASVSAQIFVAAPQLTWKKIVASEPELLANAHHFLDQGMGPAQALLEFAQWANGALEAQHVLTSAVDVPFLPQHFCEKLVDALPGKDAIVARQEDSNFPTQGLWRIESLREIEEQFSAAGLKSKGPSLRAVMDRIDVGHLEIAAGQGKQDGSMRNINRVEDLIWAQKRARRATQRNADR